MGASHNLRTDGVAEEEGDAPSGGRVLAEGRETDVAPEVEAEAGGRQECLLEAQHIQAAGSEEVVDVSRLPADAVDIVGAKAEEAGDEGHGQGRISGGCLASWGEAEVALAVGTVGAAMPVPLVCVVGDCRHDEREAGRSDEDVKADGSCALLDAQDLQDGNLGCR